MNVQGEIPLAVAAIYSSGKSIGYNLKLQGHASSVLLRSTQRKVNNGLTLLFFLEIISGT